MWCERPEYISATILPEQCSPDAVLAPQIRPPHASPEAPTLAVCWAKNRIQTVVIKLSVVKPLQTSPMCCIYILQIGPCDQKTKLAASRCPLEGLANVFFFRCHPIPLQTSPTPVKRTSSIDTFKGSLQTYLFIMAAILSGPQCDQSSHKISLSQTVHGLISQIFILVLWNISRCYSTKQWIGQVTILHVMTAQLWWYVQICYLIGSLL